MEISFKKYGIMLLAALSVLIMCSCSQPVSALDYSLESRLYENNAGETETDAAYKIVSEDLSEEIFSLTVEVKNDLGNTLSDARVTLYEEQIISYSAITDDEGKVEWSLEGGAQYLAKIECEGYAQELISIGLDTETGDVYEKITLYDEQTTEDTDGKEIDMSELSSSNSRYINLVAVRNEIYDSLTPVILGLEYELNAIVSGYMEGEENVQILIQTLNIYEDAESARDDELITSSFIQTDEIEVGNWSDILAVFLAKNGYKAEDIISLEEFSEISFEGIEEVFWDMVSISVLQTETGVNVLINCLSYQDMEGAYFLDEESINELEEMMQPDFQRLLSSVTGNVAQSFLSESEIKLALSNLPEELSSERESIVETAYSLLGKVTYFWGGKYDSIGWNAGWGIKRMVTSQGSTTTGTRRAYGLDCSGYVSWVYINALGMNSEAVSMGCDTASQWYNSYSVEWDEAKPGDLVFRERPGTSDYNHVGIIVAVEEDGTILAAHCTASENGVVVTEVKEEGFEYVRRPDFLDG